MKIYDIENFPNPARIRIALGEKGIADKAKFIPVDVMNGEHRSDEFKAKNPDASVPCMELECGTMLSQCTAITEYIDAEYENLPGYASLTGDTSKERAIIHMMNRRAEANLLDAVGAYFHYATPGLGPELETYQNTSWGNRQKDNAVATMKYLNDVLRDNEFLAGKNFSMADITAFAGLAFADFAKIDIPAELGHLLSWREKVAARPSVTS